MDPTVLVLVIAILLLAVALIVMAFKNNNPTVIFVPDYRDKSIQDLTARLGVSADALQQVIESSPIPKS
jgi:hypothetical protein